MSETIVEVVTVEAAELVVDVIVAPPKAVVVDVDAPVSAITVVEVADWASVPVTIPQLPIELQMVPVSFAFLGKMASQAQVNAPMGFPLTVLLNLAGAVFFAAVPATSDQTFTLNHLSPSSGVVPLGTITVAAGSRNSCTLAGPGGRLATGDVLQLVTPLTQDPTLQDVGITILARRE